jgi:hypothetical protein
MDTAETRPKKGRRPPIPGLKKAAKALGVSREHLSKVLHGERVSASLAKRYFEFMAEEQGETGRWGFVADGKEVLLPVGFSMELSSKSEAEKLKASYPEHVQVEGCRVTLVKPMVGNGWYERDVIAYRVHLAEQLSWVNALLEGKDPSNQPFSDPLFSAKYQQSGEGAPSSQPE